MDVTLNIVQLKISNEKSAGLFCRYKAVKEISSELKSRAFFGSFEVQGFTLRRARSSSTWSRRYVVQILVYSSFHLFSC